MNELLEIQKVALDQIANCEDLKALNDIRVNYLGKKGPIQDAMKAMKNMEKSERAEFGKVSNQVKQAIQQAIEDKKVELEEKAVRAVAEVSEVEIPNGMIENEIDTFIEIGPRKNIIWIC